MSKNEPLVETVTEQFERAMLVLQVSTDQSIYTKGKVQKLQQKWAREKGFTVCFPDQLTIVGQRVQILFVTPSVDLI